MKVDITILVPILTLAGTILTIIAGGGGYFVKDFLDKKRELNSENNKVKRDMYKKYVSLVFDLINNPPKPEEKAKRNKEFKDKVYEFYKDYSLYASVEVINALGDFMQYTYKSFPNNANTKDMLVKLSGVISGMRQEVGLSNKGLGKNGEKIFRAPFKDYDEIFNK